MAKEKNKVYQAIDAVKSAVSGDSGMKADHEKYIGWLDTAVQGRNKIDTGWMTYDLFKHGYHYAMYNQEKGEIVFQQDNRLVFRVTVNKIASTLRSVRNYVTRAEPKWHVRPKSADEAAVKVAQTKNRVLDYYFDKLRMKIRIKEIVSDALTYSVGFWIISWDTAKDCLKLIGESPYNIYFCDPFLPKDEQPYIFRVVRTLVEPFKREEGVSRTGKLAGDSKLAVSPAMALLLQTLYGTNKDDKTGTGATFFAIELYMKRDTPNKNGGYIDRITMSDVAIHKVEETEFKRYPIKMMQIDPATSTIYTDGWVKDLIPINRAINALQSWLLEFHFYVTKGRWQMDKQAGVGTVINENGFIIEHNRGSSVTPVQSPVAGASHMDQIQNFEILFEDQGGQHDASTGRLPLGAHSGKAVQALQSGDSNNLSDVVDGLELVLEEAGEDILNLISTNQITTTDLQVKGDGSYQPIKIIGERGVKDFLNGQVPEGATVIDSDNEVAVSIGSALGETEQAIRQFAIDLATTPLPQQALLDPRSALEIIRDGSMPAVEDVMNRLVNPEVQQSVGPAVPGDAQLAEMEDEKMIQGVAVPPTPNPSTEHNQIHHAVLIAPGAPEPVKQLIQAHMGMGGVLPTSPLAGAPGVPPMPMTPPTVAPGMMGG